MTTTPLTHLPASRLACLATALLLAACASTLPPARQAPVPAPQSSLDSKRQTEFDRSQDHWHGAKVQELVAKLGQPTVKSQQPDGHMVYVYSKSAKLNGPTGPVNFSCVVRYVLDERMERVASHRIEGC